MSRPQYLEPPLNENKLAIIGSGHLTSAVLRLIAAVHSSNGSPSTRVCVYTRNAYSEALSHHPDVVVSSDLREVVQHAKLVLIAVPANALSGVAQQLRPHVLPDQIALIVSRGITEGFCLPSDHIRNHTCLRKIGVIGGPLHVREIEAGRRMNAVIASKFDEVIHVVRTFAGMGAISFQHTRDVTGVQVVGAMANAAYIAAGVAEALDLGETARGVLLARGIIEAKKVGTTLGADAETFFGLAGLGELIPRHVTSLERHLQLGRLLGHGKPLSEAINEAGGHIEGMISTKVIAEWAPTKTLNLPLISAIADIIAQKVNPRTRLETVLSEPL